SKTAAPNRRTKVRAAWSASCAARKRGLFNVPPLPLGLLLAQPFQHFQTGISVLRHAKPGLIGHNGRLGAFADLAVNFAVIKAVLGQPLLQFLLLFEGKLGERPVPVVYETAIARNLVGQQ